MKHLKSLHQLLLEGKFESEEEFKKMFFYLADEVFTEEKRETFSNIVEKAFNLGFLELVKPTHSPGPPQAYYGVRRGGGLCGLSYEFARVLNDKSYDFEVVKGWNHLFFDIKDYLIDRSSFGKISHGYPYYEYKVEAKVKDGYLDWTKEDIIKLLSREYDWTIPKVISDEIKRLARIEGIEIEVSTKSYGSRYSFRDPEQFTIQITITDKTFKPNNLFLSGQSVL